MKRREFLRRAAGSCAGLLTSALCAQQGSVAAADAAVVDATVDVVDSLSDAADRASVRADCRAGLSRD